MPARHRSRQRALQVLYQWDIRQQPVQEAIDALYETMHSEEDPEPPLADPFMENLVRGTVSEAEAIDERISSKSDHWRIERMATVDRNILRLAVHEMTNGGTPAPVVIDEALELARQFSGDESVSFINGVLDAILRDINGAPPARART
ncbi:MAG: transcription antitermination factor NusB [Bryobacteraceae bacterium]